MFKRIVALWMVLCMLLSATACGNKEINANTSSDISKTETSESQTAELIESDASVDTQTSETTSTATSNITSASTSRPATSSTTSATTTSNPATSSDASTSAASYEEVDFTPISSTQDYFKTTSFIEENTSEIIHYLFHEPIRDTGKTAPLVIFLHGQGDTVTEWSPGTATPIVESLIYLENKSQEYSAYTLVPSTPLAYEGSWTETQLYAFKKLISHLIENYNIDPKRIYISGISMGGFATCRLVNEMPPDTFAAAVPLSGARDIAMPKTLYNTAFRIYHVATDTVVSVSHSRSLYQLLTESDHPNVEYTEFESGSHISPLYTVFTTNRDSFFEWLFDQRLP